MDHLGLLSRPLLCVCASRPAIGRLNSLETVRCKTLATHQPALLQHCRLARHRRRQIIPSLPCTLTLLNRGQRCQESAINHPCWWRCTAIVLVVGLDLTYCSVESELGPLLSCSAAQLRARLMSWPILRRLILFQDVRQVLQV